MEACQKERSDSLWHAKWHQSQKRWRRWSLQLRLIEMKSYQENLPWSQVVEITQAWFSGQQLVTFLTFLRIVMYLVTQEVRKHIYIFVQKKYMHHAYLHSHIPTCSPTSHPPTNTQTFSQTHANEMQAVRTTYVFRLATLPFCFISWHCWLVFQKEYLTG